MYVINRTRFIPALLRRTLVLEIIYQAVLEQPS